MVNHTVTGMDSGIRRKTMRFGWQDPPEAEWEKAARGVNGNIHPWVSVAENGARAITVIKIVHQVAGEGMGNNSYRATRPSQHVPDGSESF